MSFAIDFEVCYSVISRTNISASSVLTYVAFILIPKPNHYPSHLEQELNSMKHVLIRCIHVFFINALTLTVFQVSALVALNLTAVYLGVTAKSYRERLGEETRAFSGG